MAAIRLHYEGITGTFESPRRCDKLEARAPCNRRVGRSAGEGGVRPMSVKPSAQGSFAKTPFAHLLVYTPGKRLSGRPAVWPDSNDKKNKGQDRVLFQGGMVVPMRPVEEASSIYVGLL